MADDQTEKATPQRRQKAREEGQVVRSRELTSSLVLLAGTLLLGSFAGAFVAAWRRALFNLLEQAASGDLGLQSNQAFYLVRSLLLSTMLPVALLMGSVFSVAALVSIVQSGGITIKQNAFTLEFSRISPAQYFRQAFSFAGLTRMLKSLAPTCLLVFLTYRIISNHFLSTPPLALSRVPEMYRDAYSLLFETSLVMLSWSGLDFLAEWWTNERQLRMSKQDIRDEMKQTEGSPQVRRRIRSIQRQMRRRQLKADVSRASVVVTNPTHYAVALEFSLQTMETPKVLAKGRNLFAEQIKEEARWAGVPVVENPPLARSLYRSVDVGQTIPYDLYTVVAEILAFLYRTALEERGREKARRTRPTPQPRGLALPTTLPGPRAPRAAGEPQESAVTGVRPLRDGERGERQP